MKIKAKTKKIIVLSVMVVLLVTTGVLNFVLNDKLTSATDQAGQTQNPGVTETFFAACRSDREATRESEFLYLDAIVNSESSSQSAKQEAEKQKLSIVQRMEKEFELETLIKGKGFEDAIVTLSDNGASVVVGTEELSPAQSAQVLSIVTTKTGLAPGAVKVVPYN